VLKLESLNLNHLPLLKRCLDAHPRHSCDYTVCNLLTWGRIYNNQFAVWRDRLVLVNPKYEYVFFPVGAELPAEELLELMSLVRESYPEPELILAPRDYLDRNPDFEEYFRVTDERDWADYVYSTERMVNLSGKKLAKKKNLVSQFRRAYPDYQVLPITPSRRDVILRFTEKWKRERSAEGIFLHTESLAIQYTLEMWDSLPVEGLLICIDGRIAAYSIFSAQGPDMATIHFEKFDPDKKGSAQVINWETARHLQGRFHWINREQDMGLDGLRQAKLSYDPDFLVPFLVATPKF
jgi:hypothetical protein